MSLDWFTADRVTALGTVVGALAAASAAIAAARAAHHAATSTRASAELVAIERSRREEEVAERHRADRAKRMADVRLEVRPGSEGRQLRLFNRGPAAAHDVDFEIEPPHDKTTRVMKDRSAFPLKHLMADAEVSIGFVKTAATPPTVGVHVRWTDDDGPRDVRYPMSTATT